jgi:hypothetical protein
MARRRHVALPLRPIVGAVGVARKRQSRRRAAAARANQVHTITTVPGQQAVPTGSAAAPQRKAPIPTRKSRSATWRYKHRRLLPVAYVALALAVSKAMLHVTWLALIGLLVASCMAVASVFWIKRTSAEPVELWDWLAARLHVEQDVNDGAADIEPAQTWQSVLIANLTPRRGAQLSAVWAGLWWLSPTPGKLSAWILVLSAGVVIAFRKAHFVVKPIIIDAADETKQDAWAEFIAAKGPLEGSKMVGWSDLHSPRNGDLIGWTAGIVLPRGSKGATAVATDELRGQIGTVYDVARPGVLFDLDRDSEQRFVLSVIDQPGGNALDVVHPFVQSDFDPETGISTHSIRADWTDAQVRSYDRGAGAYHWHFSGMNGAGKSEGLENVLRQTTQHNLIVPVFADLGDLTFTDWKPLAPAWETAPDRCLQLLANLCDLIRYRQRQMAQMRRIKLHATGEVVVRAVLPEGEEYDDGADIGVVRIYPLSPATPLVQLVFDEWHLLWGNTAQLPGMKRMETIGTKCLEHTAFIVGQGRKAMISAMLATQSTSVTEGFGNSPYIRQQVQAGNMIGYRNGNSAGGQAFGGEIIVDPSTIPKDRKGACFLTSPVDARDAMSRTIWVQEPMLLNSLIRIPQLAADELAILRQGLDDNSEATPAPRAAIPAPRKGPSADLVMDVRAWIAENGPILRKPIVDHFKNAGRGSSTIVDQVLKVLKDEGVVTSTNGLYEMTEVHA